MKSSARVISSKKSMSLSPTRVFWVRSRKHRDHKALVVTSETLGLHRSAKIFERMSLLVEVAEAEPILHFSIKSKMRFSSNATILPWSGSSSGSSTYVGSDGSVDAQKYALLISINDTCVRSSLLGSRTCFFRPSMSVAARDSTVRRLSGGGLGGENGVPPHAF